MAHQIENNQIAYVGQTPWHGLGHKVDSGTTGAEMLKITGLDWTVAERQIQMETAGGMVAVDGFKAIVREDTNQVFSIPSKRYEIVQNADVVEMFREYCEAGHATMETVGGIRGGAVVWALAKLNGGSSRTLAGDDTVNGYVLFSTSHDGSMPTMGKATQIRVVCNNTLSAAYNVRSNGKGFKHYDADFRMKHSSKWTEERKGQAQSQMAMATEQAAKFNEMCERLSRVRIDGKGKIKFLMQLLNKEIATIPASPVSLEPTQEEIDRIVSGMIDNAVTEQELSDLGRVGRDILQSSIDSAGSKLASADGTLWGLVNGVSYHVDHTRGRTQDARLSQGWFGVGDTLKTDAFSQALELAGVGA